MTLKTANQDTDYINANFIKVKLLFLKCFEIIPLSIPLYNPYLLMVLIYIFIYTKVSYFPFMLYHKHFTLKQIIR